MTFKYDLEFDKEAIINNIDRFKIIFDLYK